MFKLEIETDSDTYQGETCIFHDIKLIFSNDEWDLEFAPEEAEIMKELDPEKLTHISWGPSNGECSIDWRDEHLHFCVAKYGDGVGGSLTVRINKTPELMESLLSCLKEWKALYE